MRTVSQAARRAVGPREVYAMKFYLIVAKGSKKGMPIPITIDLFLIGSDRMCQLRKESLPPKHCALVTRDQKVFLRDMDGGAATVVNGQIVPSGQEWPLHAGDCIEVGPLSFMIQYREKPLSQKDLEEWAAHCLDGDAAKAYQEYDEFHKATTASQAAQSIIDKLALIRGVVQGRLRIGVEAGVTAVRINDRQVVDESEIALIKQELCDKLGRPNLRVLIDLKNVRRLSTAGVLMLGEVHRWLRHRGSSMSFCRIHPDIAAMIATLNHEAIPQYRDKRAALLATW